MKPFVTYEKRFYYPDNAFSFMTRKQKKMIEKPYKFIL